MFRWRRRRVRARLLNEVPEHMAQEFGAAELPSFHMLSSMKFLSTWLRNGRRYRYETPVTNPQ